MQAPSSGLSDRYAAHGCAYPIDILSRSEAAEYRARVEEVERHPRGGRPFPFLKPYLVLTVINELVRLPAVLDLVEEIIGPDILVWDGALIVKEPHAPGKFTWHQDLTYWGLAETDGLVSAWLALEDVDRENGCMQFLPGTHQGGLRVHSDTWTANNILTRGQSIAIDEDACDIVHVELRAGEMSLHHGHLLHASGPNHSGRWRLGFNINYITPGNRQTVAPRDFAMLVRGKDRFGHFSHVDPPAGELDEAALGWHRRILDAQNDALYSEGAA